MSKSKTRKKILFQNSNVCLGGWVLAHCVLPNSYLKLNNFIIIIFFQICRFAKKNDLPMLEHCTLPRTGALEIILEVLGDKTKNGGAMNNGLNSQSHAINKICDVTIAYPEGKPLDLFQIAAGNREPCATHVHYRLFDVKDVSLRTYFFREITS